MKFSKFNVESEMTRDGNIYIYNLLNKKIIKINQNIKNKILNSKVLSKKFEGFLDNGTEDEKFKYLMNSMIYQTSKLNITLMMTMQCNFKCCYCFEGGIREKIKCKLDVSKVVSWIIYILEKYKMKELDLCFHGGEPTLELDKMIFIAEQLKIYCINNKIKYLFSIVTNGYLMNYENILKLYNADISVAQITIDGIKEKHDSRRPLVNGRGTFESIINNIKNNDKLKIYINIVYDLNNYSNVFELIDFLDKEKMHNKIDRIILNSTKPALKNGELYDWKMNSEFEANSRIELLNYILLKGFKVPFELDYQMCTMKQKNSFVILPNCDIYKCISGVDMKDFYICNIANDNTNDPIEKQYMILSESYNGLCSNCKYKPICNGNCIYECNVYKKDATKYCNFNYWEKFIPRYLLLISKYSYRDDTLYNKGVSEKYGKNQL